MCGRYASTRSVADLVTLYGADADVGDDALPPRRNIAPTDPVPVVLERPPSGQPDAPAVRRLTVMRWGLVPSWARDARGGARLINARVETAADKPAFRRAWAARRCVLPADGWFEWHGSVDWHGKARKQPWWISPAGGCSFAGLYEIWRDPADPDGPRLWTATVLTTDAYDEVGTLHDRAPVLLPDRDAVDRWLRPGPADPSVLASPGYAGLHARPVSPEVNDVRSEGAHLLDAWPPPSAAPLEAAPAAGPGV